MDGFFPATQRDEEAPKTIKEKHKSKKKKNLDHKLMHLNNFSHDH